MFSTVIIVRELWRSRSRDMDGYLVKHSGDLLHELNQLGAEYTGRVRVGRDGEG